MRTLMTVAALVAMMMPAYAMTGNQLVIECVGTSYRLCQGYIIGVLDMGRATQQPPICFPPGVTLGQMTSVFQKFLQDNPARLHEDGVFLVREALDTAFPCE